MRLLYLALADARGHLMRAHVLRGVLARHGVTVDIATTSDDGARFLAALGTPSTVLPGGFAMALGPRHDFSLGRTRRHLVRYALRSMRTDVAALRDLACAHGARGDDEALFVVNDSFHPALLAAHLFAPELRVVHVHGENLRAMVIEQSRPMLVRHWLEHGFAEVVHALDDVDEGRRRLPPIIALPSTRDTAPADGRSLSAATAPTMWCAVYLNPHYREPAIADLVERAVADAGLSLRGVSEPFADAGRRGWLRADPAFIDVVAGASVFLSGAGMGALEQARATGTPLVCLLGRQQEQDANARDRGLACVHLDDDGAGAKLTHALAVAVAGAARARENATDAGGGPARARREIDRVHAMWARTFLQLIDEAERSTSRASSARASSQGSASERRA